MLSMCLPRCIWLMISLTLDYKTVGIFFPKYSTSQSAVSVYVIRRHARTRAPVSELAFLAVSTLAPDLPLEYRPRRSRSQKIRLFCSLQPFVCFLLSEFVKFLVNSVVELKKGKLKRERVIYKNKSTIRKV